MEEPGTPLQYACLGIAAVTSKDDIGCVAAGAAAAEIGVQHPQLAKRCKTVSLLHYSCGFVPQGRHMSVIMQSISPLSPPIPNDQVVPMSNPIDKLAVGAAIDLLLQQTPFFGVVEIPSFY